MSCDGSWVSWIDGCDCCDFLVVTWKWIQSGPP
jgi:hypothetical protein